MDLDIDPSTLRRWLKTFRDHGLEGLPITWHTGVPPKIPEDLGPTIVDWVKKGPAACGLDRANWTYEELAHHLYQTHGIQVCAETMRQFCLKRGIRPYRPTYRFLRGDPDKQAAARDELAALKKSPGR